MAFTVPAEFKILTQCLHTPQVIIYCSSSSATIKQLSHSLAKNSQFSEFTPYAKWHQQLFVISSHLAALLLLIKQLHLLSHSFTALLIQQLHLSSRSVISSHPAALPLILQLPFFSSRSLTSSYPPASPLLIPRSFYFFSSSSFTSYLAASFLFIP